MNLFLKIFIGLSRVCIAVTFSEPLASNSEGPIKCVSLKNQLFKARLIVFDIKSTRIPFYPSTVSIYKCSRNCNTIKDLYAQIKWKT